LIREKEGEKKGLQSMSQHFLLWPRALSLTVFSVFLASSGLKSAGHPVGDLFRPGATEK
jgi:hypothetical protein